MEIMSMKRIKGYHILAGLALILVLYFPLFLHLDSLPVTVWDESLFALRALHLFEEGSYLYNFNFYTDLPNHPNTKLPFTTFFQVLGYHVFGVNELGLRLPIIFLFLGLTGWMGFYFKKHFSVWGPILIFLFILIASPGFVRPHMLRTGDQDVPFAMYLLCATLLFFQYLHSTKGKYVWGFALACIAALMTKNLLAGIIAPGLLVYVIYQKKWRWLFRRPEWYGALFLIIGVYAGSLVYFEWQHPGFIDRMWNYELMGRYQKTIEGHQGGPLYYLNRLIRGMGVFFWPAIFSPLLLSVPDVPNRWKSLIRILWMSMLSYGLIISFSATKTSWYVAPLYPGFALLSAVSLWHLYQWYFVNRPRSWQVSVSLICIFIYSWNYGHTIASNYKPKPSTKGSKYGLFLKQLDRSNAPYREFTILDNNFGTSAYFYTQMYNRLDPTYQLTYKRYIHLQPGQKLMSCLNDVLKPIDQKYEYKVLEEYSGCQLLEITAEK